MKPSDLLKPGDSVEIVILGVNPADKRISLGLKQALGDPWDEVEKKYPIGAVVEGPVTQLKQFGAFVQVTEDVEGMIHVGDIAHEKRINHPQDVLKVGQVVRTVVLENDREKRRLRLGLKQLHLRRNGRDQVGRPMRCLQAGPERHRMAGVKPAVRRAQR